MIWDFSFFFSSILVGVGLAMDAFSVSLADGLNEPCMKKGRMCAIAGVFAFFQALMPLIGWALTTHFSTYLQAVDHWIAFAMLAFIGGKMIRDSFKGEEEEHMDPGHWKTQLAMAVATSIDALAVGISLAMAGGVNIFSAVAFIGLTTFAFSAVGVKIGSVFGGKFQKKAQMAGGFILMIIGLNILLEHLGIMV